MRRLLLLFPLLFLVGCGAQMRTMPVGAQRVQYNASIGGPLVNAFGAVVPIPYATAGATYGVSDRVEVHADLHVLAAAFKFFGFTPGVTYFPPLLPDGWVPSLTADLLLFSDFNAARAYPELLLAVAHPMGTKWVPYLGVRNTFQTTRGPAYIPSLFGGASYSTGHWKLYGELQWLALNRSNHFSPVDYHGISEHGALSPQFGVSMDLGGKK